MNGIKTILQKYWLYLIAEIRPVLQKYWLYLIPVFIAGLAFGYILAEQIKVHWIWFWDGFWPEAIGIIVTAGFIDRRIRRREEQRTIRERNERLIRQIGSTVNDVAKDAVHEARNDGFLQGSIGLLKEAELENAIREAQNDNLLQGSNGLLKGVGLWSANLEGAGLYHANLTSAILMDANLKKANLWRANLESTKLWKTNLEGADLNDANLVNATLWETNLKGAKLPDKTIWMPDTDMTKFTDPNHTDFWQPNWARASFESWWDWHKAGEPSPPTDTQNP